MTSPNVVRKSDHAYVLVCRTCGDAFKTTPSTSVQLKRLLEDGLLAGQGWEVRVVESGCLDVCPVGAVTVRLVGAENSAHKTLTWTWQPAQDAEDLLAELRKYLVARRTTKTS